jgi:hypothetical protein
VSLSLSCLLDVEDTYQALNNAAKGLSTQSQPQAGIAYSGSSGKIPAGSNNSLSINTSTETPRNTYSHPDGPISVEDVRDNILSGKWDIRVADLGKWGYRDSSTTFFYLVTKTLYIVRIMLQFKRLRQFYRRRK